MTRQRMAALNIVLKYIGTAFMRRSKNKEKNISSLSKFPKTGVGIFFDVINEII